jgi:hypothetical protein
MEDESDGVFKADLTNEDGDCTLKNPKEIIESNELKKVNEIVKKYADRIEKLTFKED